MGKSQSEKGYLRRAFLALKTDQGQTHLLHPVRQDMPKNWRISNPHDDHMSLAFCGKLNPAESNHLRSLVREFAKAAEPITISFPMLGTFQNTHPGKQKDDTGDSHIVIYAAPDASAAQKIQSLHYDLAFKVLRPNGFQFGLSKMIPHNTLAHIKDVEGERVGLEKFLTRHPALDIPPARYESIVLMDSCAPDDPNHPEKHGNTYSKYTVIEEFPLGGKASNVKKDTPLQEPG